MGQGYSCKCDKCDYTIEYYQGIGFQYPMEAEKMLTAMKQGKFGKRFMEAANKAAVQLSPTFFGWCLSFGDKLQVTGPDDVVTKVTDYIQSLTDGYRKDRGNN